MLISLQVLHNTVLSAHKRNNTGHSNVCKTGIFVSFKSYVLNVISVKNGSVWMILYNSVQSKV